MKPKEKRGVMEVSTWILLGLTLLALGVAFLSGRLAGEGVSAGREAWSTAARGTIATG